MKVLIDKLIWRKDLYPRFEPNPSVIQQYADCVDLLPPIEINQKNEIIDGYHRWVAHKKAKANDIEVIITETENDTHLQRLAIERNAKHGLQLSNEEKKSLAVKFYDGLEINNAYLAELLSVSQRTISRWTSRKEKDLKREREKNIFNLWLACHTEEEIAKAIGLTRQAINLSLKESQILAKWPKLAILAEYKDEMWKAPLYNVWKRQTKTNAISIFGQSEQQFLDNLLYMYTEPFDIVVDPFGGAGSTIDVCKKRLRRYWVSDRKPPIERLDVRQWEVLDGPPPLHKRWGGVSLLYLDPPYWHQAKGRYSEDAQDFGNMELEDFYESLAGFVLACAEKMPNKSLIAMLMQPTQWANEDKSVVDHVVHLIDRIGQKHLALEIRISCPYESQQCTAQMVEWAKANRRVLVISRELIVWRVEKK